MVIGRKGLQKEWLDAFLDEPNYLTRAVHHLNRSACSVHNKSMKLTTANRIVSFESIPESSNGLFIHCETREIVTPSNRRYFIYLLCDPQNDFVGLPGFVGFHNRQSEKWLYHHGLFECELDGHRFWALESLPQQRTLPTFSCRSGQFGSSLRIELLLLLDGCPTDQHPLGAVADVRRVFLVRIFCRSAFPPGRLRRGRFVGIVVASPTRQLPLGTAWLARLREREQCWWLPLFISTPTSPLSGCIEIDLLLDAKFIECS